MMYSGKPALFLVDYFKVSFYDLSRNKDIEYKKPVTYLHEIAAVCPVLVFTDSRLAIIVIDIKQKKSRTCGI